MFENISKIVMSNSMQTHMLCMKFYTLETTNVLTGANAVVMFGKRPALLGNAMFFL